MRRVGKRACTKVELTRLLRAFAHALSVLALALAGASALAGNYPQQQPLKIVVPFTAGGGVDVVARIIAPPLSEQLGQSVIIENRGGAGGALGAAAVAQAPPDGYTLLFGTGSTHGTNPNVYAKLSYDPVRDFVPVALVSSSPLLLVAPPHVPANSVAELIALAPRPSPASCASAPTAPAASIIWSPSCSTPWRASRPTTSPIAARRRC